MRKHNSHGKSIGKNYDETLPNDRLPDWQYLHLDRKPFALVVYWYPHGYKLVPATGYLICTWFLRAVKKSDKSLQSSVIQCAE